MNSVRTATVSLWVAVFGVCCAVALASGGTAHADGAAGTQPSASKRRTKTPKTEQTTSGVVLDRFAIEMRVGDLRFYEASSGFLSSGKGKKLKSLRLWNGAHQISVEVKRLRRVEVFLDEIDAKNDLIWIQVTLLDGTKSKAKVERTLEVRGTVHLGAYKIRIDRVKRIEFDR